MATRMQQRRGTFAQWDASNPILNIGEIGFESDNNKFKIGDGVNHWNDLPYFLDAATIGTSLDGYIPESLLGAANGVAQLNSSGLLVSSQIPNIDEITQDAINTALVAGTGLDKTYDDNGNTITLDIDSTVATKTYADTAVSTHSSDSTSVHGITDTAELATKTFAAELLTNATKTNITITGDKTGLTITAENGVADSTTTDLAEGTNLYFTDERAQDAVGNAIGTGLTYTDSTGEIKVTPNTYDAYGSAAAITPSTLGLGNVDNTSDANKPVSTATQTALDLKAPLANPTFTGTVAGITKSMVGLGNVDNTTDANKPVSTATQTALDLKANLSSPALTGSPTAPTQSAGDNSTKIATTAYADAAVAALVDSAPGALNTLNELAAAINDDASYAATITTALGTKASLTGAETLTNKTLEDPSIFLHYQAQTYEIAYETRFVCSADVEQFTITTTTWTPFDTIMDHPSTGAVLSIYSTAGGTNVSGNYPLVSVSYAVGNDPSEGATYTFDSISNPDFDGQFDTTHRMYLLYNSTADVGNELQYLVGLDTNISNALGNTIAFSEKGSNNGVAALSSKGTVLTITPNSNVGVGTSNFADLSTGSFNTAVGSAALYLVTTGNSNTSVGNSALANTTTGYSNIAIGVDALQNNTIGVSNIAIGVSAMWNAQELENNIAIGHYAGSDLSTGSDNIIIGHGSQASSDTITHEITLGNNDITRFRIPGLNLDTNSATNGQVLSWNTSTGKFAWSTITGYSAPTIGSTSIASGATVSTIAGLTKITSSAFVTTNASGHEQDLAIMNIMGAF